MNVLSKISRNSSKSSLGEDVIEFPLNDRETPLPLEMELQTNDREKPRDNTSHEKNKDDHTQDDNKKKEKSSPSTPFNHEILETSQCEVGNILIQVASRLNKLEDKMKMKNPRIDLTEMCYSYNTKKRDDQVENEQMIEDAVQNVQERLVASKLNFHVLDHRIEPPKEFGTRNQLHKPEVLRMAMMLFPKTKYDNSNSSGDITEFLERTVQAQKRILLNESEYLEMLLMCTTGEAHTQLKLYIDNGESISSIFFRLLTLFDKSLTIDAARNQLHNLKGHKGDTLASLEAKILKLSAIVGRQWKSGEMRQNFCDLGNCQTLIYSLPDKGSDSIRKRVQQNFNMLAAQLNRAPTFAEFMAALQNYTEQINAALKETGDSNREYMRHNNNVSARKNDYRNKKFNINSVQNKQFNSGNRNYTPNQDRLNGRQGSYNKNGNWNQGKSKNYQNFSASRGDQVPRCSLCRSTRHTASQGCRRMVNKDGQVVLVAPVQERCPICYDKTGYDYFHPTAYCYRKKENTKFSKNSKPSNN